MTRKETVTSSKPLLFLSYNPERVSFTLYNEGADIIYISTNEVGVKDTGIPVYPDQTLILSEELGDNPSLSYWAIADSTTANIRIKEVYAREVGIRG